MPSVYMVPSMFSVAGCSFEDPAAFEAWSSAVASLGAAVIGCGPNGEVVACNGGCAVGGMTDGCV